MIEPLPLTPDRRAAEYVLSIGVTNVGDAGIAIFQGAVDSLTLYWEIQGSPTAGWAPSRIARAYKS